MNTIGQEIIHQTWEQLMQTPPEDMKGLVAQMADEQPAILAYLKVNDEEWSEGEEPGTLLFLGLVAWQIMSSERSPLEEVTPVDLQKAEDENIRFLENLSEDSEIGCVDAVSQMVSSYNQMPLLGSILEALMEGNEDQPELAGDSVGMYLVFLKTVIDCLDQ